MFTRWCEKKFFLITYFDFLINSYFNRYPNKNTNYLVPNDLEYFSLFIAFLVFCTKKLRNYTYFYLILCNIK